MYEARSEVKEFVGENRADAVAKACAFFRSEEDGLSVSEPPAGEIYGLSGRCVVTAVPRDAVRTRDNRPRDEDRPRDHDHRGGRGERHREEGRRDRDDGRRGESRRGGRPNRSDRERESRAPRAERSDSRTEDASDTAEPIADSKAEVIGEVGPIGDFVSGMVERMGLGSFSIAEDSDGEYLVYQLRGSAAIELGSGDGRGVDAIQLLANQFAMRTEENAPRVVIDAEGDSERRESFLTRLATRAAKRAQDTRRSVALDPMNGRDRRAVHVALRDADGVATMSIGSGQYRQVVVVPEGSPEYDDARRSAEEAAEREDRSRN